MPDPSPSTTATAFASARELGRQMSKGEISSVEIVETLLKRFDALDRAGPELRAVLATCQDALATASHLDDERRRGDLRGPLHGVPVLVKDNIDTVGTEGTTAGSKALLSSRPGRDATVVSRLRAAGAIVIAKANLSEWANFRGERSSSGWSGVGGQCRNPYALERSPGGSSSGSGAGVAAGLAPLAVGTETDGSILCPSALNGVVGIKPTVGLTSRAGVVPISFSQDSVGPIARSVADAAMLLGVLGGSGSPGDTRDPATARAPAGLPAEYAPEPGQGFAGLRIGVPGVPYFGYSPKADALVTEALAAARTEGAVTDECEVPTARELADSDDEMTVLVTEFGAGLRDYLATRVPASGPVPSIEDVIAFNQAHRSEELAFFGQELLERAAASNGVDDPEYLKARDRNLARSREQGIDAALSSGDFALLCMPTMGPAWCIDHVNGDMALGSSYKAAAIAGYPAISIPIGLVNGLPVGMTLVGRAWSEPVLIRAAAAFERLVDLSGALRPEFLPSVAGP